MDPKTNHSKVDIVDVGRVLGGLMANRAARGGGNGQVLGQILSGVADITAAANSGPRFPPTHHRPFEHIVRESAHRYHHGGGRFPAPADPYFRGGTRVPTPRHDDDHHHGHHAQISFRRRAEVLITAMVMAAQADGHLEPAEQDHIVDQIQPLSREEADFLRKQFRRRHNVEQLVDSVPTGMEYEVYVASLMSIDLDTHAEANYLRRLAECMRMNPAEVNDIHARVGAPPLF